MKDISKLDRWVQVVETEDEVRITILLYPNCMKDVIALIGLILWALSELFFFALALVALGLSLWSACIISCLLVLVSGWLLYASTEQISLTRDHLSLRILPLGLWHRYPIAEIRDLGLSELGRASTGLTFGIQALSFDFRHRLVLFGRGLSAKTARQVVAVLHGRLQPPEESTTPALQNSITPEVNLDQS